MQLQFTALTVLIKVSLAKKDAFWADVKDLFNKTKFEALVQPLGRGSNPLGNLYTLPENSIWSEKGSFPIAHFFPPSNSSEVYYDKVGGLDVYFQELDRGFYIQDTLGKLRSSCSSKQCANEVFTDPASGSAIKLSEIPSLTMQRIRMAHLDRRGCHSAKVSIHSTLQSILFKQANVLLYIKIKASIFDGGKLEDKYVETLKFHIALENDTCDSILTYF